MLGAFASKREGGSRVPSGQLDHLSQAEDGHRELRSRRQVGQDVADPPVIGRVAHGDALNLQDETLLYTVQIGQRA